MLNMLHFVQSVAHASLCGTTVYGLGYPRRTPVFYPQHPPAGCSGGVLPRVLWHNKNTHQVCGANIMPKEQKSNKEGKKKPIMTPKEKKAAKKSKKESKLAKSA